MNKDIILLDIDTQEDFLMPAGSLYTGRAEMIRANIYKLIGWAKHEKHPIISTVLRVPHNHNGPYGAVAHCIEDTPGERKLTRTILESKIDLGMRNVSDLPVDLFDNYQQVIIERRFIDVFEHNRIERLITNMRDSRFIVLGSGLCGAVVQAIIGLLSRGYEVLVPADAILDIQHTDSEMVWKRMQAKNAIITHTTDITQTRKKSHPTPATHKIEFAKTSRKIAS